MKFVNWINNLAHKTEQQAQCKHEHIEMGKCLSCGKLVWEYTANVPNYVRNRLHFTATNQNHIGRVKDNMSSYPSISYKNYEWKKVILIGDIGENVHATVIYRRKLAKG
jgi:hypothetical protein